VKFALDQLGIFILYLKNDGQEKTPMPYYYVSPINFEMKSQTKITNQIFCYFTLTTLLTMSTLCLRAQNPVKTHEPADIGGIKQWIGARSTDDTKPLLLFLHGGPGFSSRTYSRKFINYLKKDFIVAQWDQRETGITAYWGPYKDSLTLELFHQDTEEVVNYLLKRFYKKKLFLVGFSWGGFLGLHFANEHPELLHAYISVSGMIHTEASELLTLSLINEKAKAVGDTEALEEISRIRIPFNSWEELYYQRKWTAYFLDGNASTLKYPKSLFQEWSKKWMDIYRQASKVNYTESIQEVHCPIYFFVSKKDFVSNHVIAEKYFNSLQAKQKQIIWFEQSTHEIPNQEPKKFSYELIKIANQIDK
jgi:pimeloyl-ACP methyl ester carboxylesterase